MTRRLAWTLMALTARSLGPRRSDWARAMAAELEVAEAQGHPLRFALGCLFGTWRTMLGDAEGRFTLVAHALAIGVVLPVAGMLSIAATFGFPFMAASDGLAGFLFGSGERTLLLNVGNMIAAPSLLFLMLLTAGLHLPVAWWILDRDWDRVGRASRFGAAAVTTLTIVSGCAAIDPTTLILPIWVLAAEIAAIFTLATWQSHLPRHEQPAF
ncbi:hypothetical protein COC42_10545 [Sphingomonas spermidinifaciens]|uniref:Uncharacterized protein n=1 Tax=Sphingomonas spermidinifaciens TaxID=1141889 RepID=A0A2A4B2M2_9SPHN|nr:hypothetical protein [Sphingomonas spermidinifaciens]PCD01934.1 hypothetical protein COC42_10545 [Sphingomonas spermidinifaciens]